MADPFATLGVDARFDVDEKSIEKRHRELSRVLHPDRHASASASERRLSLAKAIEVNEAFRVLRDPIRRAEALLRLSGVEIAEGKEPKADGAFLMQMMEEREALSDAKRARKADEVARLGDAIGARRDAAIFDLTRLFVSPEFSARDPMAIEQVARRIGELRYYRRFLDEVSAIEDEIGEAAIGEASVSPAIAGDALASGGRA